MASARDEPAGGAAAASPGDALEIRAADGAISMVQLTTARLVIGRSGNAHVKLDCRKVSWEHAELVHDPFDRWWIRDLGSLNGTKVNGVVIREAVLTGHDTVEIGRCLLRLCQPPSSPGALADELAQTLRLTEEPSESISTLPQFEAPRVAASQLSMLLVFGRQLLDILEPRDRLQALCRLMVGNEFRGRWAAAVRLPPGPGDEPPHALCEPASAPDWQGWSPYVSKGLLRAVRERNEPILASNVPAAPADVNLTLPPEVMPLSALACPLIHEGPALDILYVVLPPEFGTSEWLALVSVAVEEFRHAQHAWAARHQAELHAAIERELEQARRIQMRLVPREPAVPGMDVAIGFEPCRWVGGDYVDIVPMADGRTLLTMADVCGKGLQAALVAAGLHTMVRALLGAGLGLEDLMRGLNDHLSAYLVEGSFVTMVSLAVDPRTGEVECANAGHPPPLVLGPTGEMHWLKVGGNLPLGVGARSIVRGNARIDSGEMLVLFTDGLTDLMGQDGERLGLGRLGDLLSSVCTPHAEGPISEVSKHLTTALDQVRGKSLPEDDRTYLLARRL